MEVNPDPISINLLGELQILVAGEVVELPASKKTRALIAYLSLSERPQRRERLCEIFWDIPDDPRGSLRWSLSKIRKALEVGEKGIVVADRDMVSLDRSRLEIDVERIDRLAKAGLPQCATEELETAAAMFRGPILAGMDLQRSADFEAWRIAHCNRLELIQIGILTVLADRYCDQPVESLRFLTQLQSLRPEDENLKNRINLVNATANNDAMAAHSDAYPGHISSPNATALQEKPAIVVLPFTNMSGDSEQEYFSDGVTEDIITALSRIRWLFVIARNTSYTYKGVAVNVAQVARDLNVRYVLEGSVQKSGARIRITAQLIDGESGNHLWAERYDRDLDHMFEVQDEITENIAGALEPQMVVAESVRSQKIADQNPDAWDLTIRAAALSREFTNNGSRQALALLERALKIDPSYARAHSQKAWLTCWRIHQGWEKVEKALEVAVKAAEKAVYHDPDEPWGHIAWLFIATIKRDGDLLVSAAHKAIDVNPNFAMAHSWLGAAYALTGQGEKSFEWIEKARRLSPRDMFREEFDVHTSFAYFQIADYEKAIVYASRASIPRPEHVYPLLIMASSRAHLDQLEDALNDVERIQNLVPGYSLEIARDSCVFVNSADIDRYVDGLKKAGLKGQEV